MVISPRLPCSMSCPIESIAVSSTSPFYESSCSDVLEATPLDFTHCGAFEAKIFGECRTQELEMTTNFMEICVYDYCENYYTKNETTLSSGCLLDGKDDYLSTIPFVQSSNNTESAGVLVECELAPDKPA